MVFKFSNVFIVCSLAMLLLAGCGQKNDLYLPSPTAVAAPAASDVASDASSNATDTTPDSNDDDQNAADKDDG